MKSILILCIALFVSGTASAETRGILIEFVTHQADAPTVNVYSEVEAEQKTGISVVEAAAILSKAQHWGSRVLVSVLSETNVETKYLLGVLDGMKDNFFLEVRYVELGSRSAVSTQLLTQFKSIPRKASSP